ncbi:MAG: MerR family transcriptional regulator [Rhodospirillales bacterium]|nr:MerR family transcriptional regulator [Rhodospirillales bacterium]
MFRIGDFSKIARVSGRLLRYYDGIGLLSPGRIDPQTGYRYYTAGQLARLNKILALKALGLSLEQIARMLDGSISSDEIRGMFLLRRAELERSLDEEAARLRNVEARLQQMDHGAGMDGLDVLLKPQAALPFLAYRKTFPDLSAAVDAVQEVARYASRRIPERVRGPLVVVAHADFEDEDLDLELGHALNDEFDREIVLPSEARLMPAELPEEPLLACVVRTGSIQHTHLAYGAIGVWLEANQYDISGPCREVFLKPPFEPPDPETGVVEIQFPVRRAA